MWAASGSRGPQSYNLKEMNPANRHMSLEGDTLASDEMSALANTLIETLSGVPS